MVESGETLNTGCTAWAPWKLSGKRGTRGEGSLPGLHGPQHGLSTMKTAGTLPCCVSVNYSIQLDHLNQWFITRDNLPPPHTFLGGTFGNV